MVIFQALEEDFAVVGDLLLSSTPHSTDQHCRFNPQRLKLSGDIQPNPGPIKYPCKECNKSVRNNQNAILCSECKHWFHAKCLHVSFKYYLDQPNLDWICPMCSLLRLSDSFFSEEMDSIDRIPEASNEIKYANQQMADICDINNKDDSSEFNHFIRGRKEKPSEVLLIHLNINSLQNKFEELKSISDEAKPHIVFILETKIDGSYPNDQFNLPGYYMHCCDTKKRRWRASGLLSLHYTLERVETA